MNGPGKDGKDDPKKRRMVAREEEIEMVNDSIRGRSGECPPGTK